MDFFEELEIMSTDEEGWPQKRYQAEPLTDLSGVYEAFDEMRTVHLRLGEDEPFYVLDAVSLFVVQARHMADFTDYCPRVVRFDQYYPTYAEMTDSQLRTYFTWRTKVREGFVERTSLAYVFVYIYELLNQVGVESPQEGLEKLIGLWHSYRDYDKKLDRYFLRWLKDYWIYYIGDDSYGELQRGYPEDLQDDLLLYDEILQRNYENKLELFNQLSSYKFLKSKFYASEQGTFLAQYTPLVLRALDRYFAERDLSFPQLLLGPKEFNVWWEPFPGAVFRRDAQMPDKRVDIGKVESYICKDGCWTVNRLQRREAKKLLGYVFKATESALREVTGFGKKLQLDLVAGIADFGHEQRVVEAILDPEFALTIRRTVQEYWQETHQEPVKKIAIDTSKLAAIRRDAEVVQEKLTVEEDQEEALVTAVFAEEASPISPILPMAPVPPLPPTVEVDPAVLITPLEPAGAASITTDSPWQSFAVALSAAQKQLLRALVQAQDVKEVVREHTAQTGVLPELLWEEINELSLAYLDDTILDLGEEIPLIYEDYLAETAKALEDEQ